MHYYHIITLDGQSMLLLFFFFHLDDVSYKRSCLSVGKRGNGERKKKRKSVHPLFVFCLFVCFVVGALVASLRSLQNRSELLEI